VCKEGKEKVEGARKGGRAQIEERKKREGEEFKLEGR